MTPYRKLFYKLGPKWLTSGEGESVLFSLHVVVDAWLERARLGVYARFPDSAPDDAIVAISRDRKIIRGLNENKASFAKRLIKWLDTHRIRGNPFALLEQIRAYLQAEVVLRTVDQNGNWFWIDADGSHHFQLQAGHGIGTLCQLQTGVGSGSSSTAARFGLRLNTTTAANTIPATCGDCRQHQPRLMVCARSYDNSSPPTRSVRTSLLRWMILSSLLVQRSMAIGAGIRAEQIHEPQHAAR